MAVRQEDLLIREAIVYPFPGTERRRRAARSAVARRRRVLSGTVTVVLCVGMLLGGGPEGAATASKAGAPEVVRIHAGETLWDLAERYAPASVDPRAYVDAVQGLNDLDRPPLPGTRLRLP